MSILQNVPFNKHIASIRDAADAFAKEARKRFQGRTWSICELELTGPDVQWLSDWAAAVQEDQITLTLRQDSRLAAVGLLLLAYASENLRRDGRERGIYEVFAEGPFSTDVREALFTASGYPRAPVRKAIEDACRLFGLRHAFDSPTTQPWYLTIKLQFGFTLPSARDQLEHWLVGVPPDAIKLLLQGELQSNASGTQIRSDTYRALWDALLRFRSGRIRRDSAKLAIEQSPWALAHWADDLLLAADRRILGASNAYVPVEDRLEAAEPVAIEDVPEPSVFGKPTVAWLDGEIKITAPFDEGFLEQISGDYYVVSVNDQQCDVLRRQTDGSYMNLRCDLRLELPVESEEVLVSIADDQGRGIASQRLEVFDRDADFQAFSRSGHRVSVNSLSTDRGYTLRLPIGSVFHPDSDLQCRTQMAKSIWAQLSPGWQETATIKLPGDPEPLAILGQKDDAKEDWTDTIQLSAREAAGGNRFVVCVAMPNDVSLVNVKICGLDLSLNTQPNGRYQSNPVTFSMLGHDGVATLRLLAKRERLRVVYRKVKVPREGLLIFGNGSWRNHPVSSSVNSTALSRTEVAIVPGSTNREEGWTLVEGERRLSYRNEKPRRLNELGRRGWPLRITDHRFNRTGDAKLVTLSQSIIDQGIVAEGIQRPGSRLVSLELLHNLEASNDRHCVIWTRSGRLANIAAQDIRVDGKTWIIDPANAGIEYEDLVVAASVAFRGTWLGSWWTDEWWRPITRVRNEAVASEVAACLRWFGLPLMQRAGDIREVATLFGREFFSQWCLPCSGGPESQAEHQSTDQFLSHDLLRQDEHESGWIHTVRSLLRDWLPTAEDSLAIAPDVWEPQDGSSLADGHSSLEGIVISVATSLPVVAARLINVRLSQPDLTAGENGVRQVLACELRKNLDERAKAKYAKMKADGIELRDQHPALPWLPFSESFVNALVDSTSKLVLGETLTDLDADNLETALNSSELCRFIAARMIALDQVRVCV